jgi:uncharacterized hydrophobic protein (TIGR00271 family)
MINVEVFGRSELMATVAELLEGAEGVERVRLLDAARPGHSVVVAASRPRVVDELLGELDRAGVPGPDITLSRIEVVGRAAGPEASLVWEDVLGTAWLNARPVARYLAFMLVAGVVACYGVVDRNAILIVGAMAVSPDLLPITAIGVGLVGRQGRLAVRALATLGLGLAVASLAAAAFAAFQDLLDLLPSGFDLDASSLGTLTTLSDETFVVALFAGVAGMLALETRASAGVGVAISVTTIPAAAYMGVALGLGELGTAWGALGVLTSNVAMLVVGASATLMVQRAIRARARAMRAPVRPMSRA